MGRQCASCGKELRQREREPNANFARRKFCCRACYVRNVGTVPVQAVRCECDAPATRAVWFWQMNSQGTLVLGHLSVCETCAAEMVENDAGVMLENPQGLELTPALA